MNGVERDFEQLLFPIRGSGLTMHTHRIKVELKDTAGRTAYRCITIFVLWMQTMRRSIPPRCRDHTGALPSTDQRGFNRPANGSPLCDIGAYEAGAAEAPTPTPTPTLVPTVTLTPDYWNYLAVIK